MKKLFLILTFFTLQITAQSLDPQDKLGAWYMYGGSHKISEKFSAKTLAHFRFFDMGNDFQQLLIRVAGNYKINNTVNVSLGYAYFNTDATFGVDGGGIGESRIYEDVNVKHKTNKLGWAHRFRFEQRLLDSGLQNLIRYKLNLSHPISEKWSTYINNEIFFDFIGESYNSNWFGTGFKYKLNNAVKLQLGYQNISQNGGANFNRILIGIALNTK